MAVAPQFDLATFGMQLGGFSAVFAGTLKLATWLIGKILTRNEALEAQRTETTNKLYEIINEQSRMISAKIDSEAKLNETLHSVVMAELESCHSRNTKLETKVDQLQLRLDEIQRNRI